MATSITLDQLPAAVDQTRRDQWGRYLVVPPEGGNPVGYTRVTTVAKTLDSEGGLAPWKATMCAEGILLRRGLRARWEALMALYGGDPWYASEAAKAECKALVEECAAVGGANDRREMGSSLHTITALADVGRRPEHLTEETERDLEAYLTGLALAGVDIVPGMVELTVVLDSWRVAGTFDRLVTVPGFDLPLIADLKTGAELSYSWQTIAVQLAAYSRAEAIYVQGTAPDGSQDVRQVMPEVDQDHGLILWLNAGTGTLELWLVDLAQGWVAFDLSMQTRGWRKAQTAIPLADHTFDAGNVNDLTPLLEASIAAVEEMRANTDRTLGTVGNVEPEPSDTEVIDVYQEPDTTYTERLRAWLQRRIDTIGSHMAARTELAAMWPEGMPALRASTEHTPEELDAIEALLDLVEREHSIPFGESKPTTDPVGQLLHLFPNSTLEEGPA